MIAGHRPSSFGGQGEKGHHMATGQGRGQSLLWIGMRRITAPIWSGVHVNFMQSVHLHDVRIGVAARGKHRGGALPMQLNGKIRHRAIQLWQGK